MTLDVARVRSKIFRGASFSYAEIQGSVGNDHASWWSFDDEQELRDRWWNPKEGETVLDIGAAFGSYGIPALALGARVIFFSPADFDTELLTKNLELNPALRKRALVLRDGSYSRDGWFDPDPDHCRFRETPPDACDTCEGLVPRAVPLGGYDLCPKCKQMTLARWLRVRSVDSVLRDRPGIEHVSWMKLDVEGAELEVLKGAEKCIRQDRPKILVENHTFQVADMETKVRDYLFGLGLGYTIDGPHQHCSVSHSFFEAATP